MTCVTSRFLAVAPDNASALHQLLFFVLSNPLTLDDDCSVSFCPMLCHTYEKLQSSSPLCDA